MSDETEPASEGVAPEGTPEVSPVEVSEVPLSP